MRAGFIAQRHIIHFYANTRPRLNVYCYDSHAAAYVSWAVFFSAHGANTDNYLFYFITTVLFSSKTVK